MTKYIKIDEDPNLKVNKNVKNYLDPDYIYIPFAKGFKVNVRNHEEVLMNGVALSNGDEYIYSPVSGDIVGLSEMITDGVKNHTIVIENNFEENTASLHGVKKNINNYKPIDVINLINTYNAYHGVFKGNTMVINGIDSEPYEANMSYLISKHTDEILECIDALYNIFNVHKCFLAIKNNDNDNVDELVNYIGTYPNINLKLMPDVYPIGKKNCLINELVMESKKENGIIYLTVEEVYAIYNVLKRCKPITEKLVTFGGNLLNKSAVLNVKIGTSLKDIISDNFKITNDDYHIIINGLMSGYEVDTLDTIITSNIKSVFINSLSTERENKCINCGMCNNYCPFNCDPRTGYNMDKCIKCGICNYVCPSKRKLVGDKHD